MDPKVVRRRRATLALLVGLSVALLTVYFGETGGGTLHVLQRGAQEALSPLQTGASRAFEPVRDTAGWTRDTVRAKSENDTLRRENSRLRRDLARAQTDRRDLAQLRGLEALAGRASFPGGHEPVTARVIARSPSAWYSGLGIDRGRDDGVRIYQPVIASEGLIGTVTEVTSDTARVTLITDETSAVSAQVVPGGATGVVKPRVGEPDDLLLGFIERGKGIKRGQTVITAGSRSSRVESLFPRGIPVGRISKVDSNDLELYQRVHLKPFVDPRRTDFVQVLVPDGSEQRAEAAP